MAKKILFLCTGNSCRSQMAEGFARVEYPQIEVLSAGTKPGTLNQTAVTVMKEKGIDISKHFSKSVDSLGDISGSLLVTVCDNAKEACPTMPGFEIIHNSFDDPPELSEALGSEEEKLNCYRRVRDEIEEFVKTLA